MSIEEEEGYTKATRKEQKAEAVERMKLIGIFPETIKQFENEDLVSESTPPLGACFWIDEKQKKFVKDFEREYNGLVYHVIHSYTNIGEMLSLLYVCDIKEEWKLDREDIKNGQAFCYVCNLDGPDLSELGAIGFKLTPAAGLVRTW